MNTTDPPLKPRYEHALTCGHKFVSDARHTDTARCSRDDAQEVTGVTRFHVDSQGYRRGPVEVIA